MQIRLVATKAHFSACFCAVENYGFMTISISRKYKKYCLQILENFCVHTLDTLCHIREISKDLQHPQCVKKLLENGIYSSEFLCLTDLRKEVKNYYIFVICNFYRKLIS